MAGSAVPFLALLAAAITGGTLLAAAIRARDPHPLARYLGWIQRRHANGPCIAFYAVSHGELLLLEKLLPLLAQKQPQAEIIVIVPSNSVRRVAQQRLGRFPICCCSPIVPWGTATALRRLRPDIFVVVEFARIPLWIRSAKSLGVPLVIINGRLSEKNQSSYARWPWLFGPMIQALDRIMVQSAADAEDWIRHGAAAEAIEITGVLKFDAASFDRDIPATRRLARLAGIQPDETVFLAGSTREGEEAVAASIFARLSQRYPKLRMLVVPRNHHRFAEVAELFTQHGLAWERRSTLEQRGHHAAARVLLIDSVGELSAWWGAAHVGFVGASLTSRGGQNMIEPAALGVATCFGPHTANFRDVTEVLLANKGAVQVKSEAELEAFVSCCLDDPSYASALGRQGQEVCRRHMGAMPRTCQRLSDLLSECGAKTIRLGPPHRADRSRRAA